MLLLLQVFLIKTSEGISTYARISVAIAMEIAMGTTKTEMGFDMSLDSK